MNQTEQHLCVGYNKAKGLIGLLHKAHNREHYKCQNKGSIFENEKWYCKRHAPSKIKEREAKSELTYLTKIRMNL